MSYRSDKYEDKNHDGLDDLTHVSQVAHVRQTNKKYHAAIIKALASVGVVIAIIALKSFGPAQSRSDSGFAVVKPGYVYMVEFELFRSGRVYIHVSNVEKRKMNFYIMGASDFDAKRNEYFNSLSGQRNSGRGPGSSGFKPDDVNPEINQPAGDSGEDSVNAGPANAIYSETGTGEVELVDYGLVAGKYVMCIESATNRSIDMEYLIKLK